MIAISSIRPHSESPEYKRNQIAAHRSWIQFFDRIYYFGVEQDELNDSKTYFIPSEEFPTIKSMLIPAATSKMGFSVLLNADIILTPPFKTVIDRMIQNNILGGTSKRINFDPDIGFSSGKVEDLGVDIFVAHPTLWRKVYQLTPKNIRIGHPTWDTFILGALNAEGKSAFVDFSHFNCVYHPRHGGRKAPFGAEATIVGPNDYMKNCAFPGRRLH